MLKSLLGSPSKAEEEDGNRDGKGAKTGIMEQLQQMAKSMTDMTERLTSLTTTVNDFDSRLNSVAGDVSLTAAQQVKEHFQPELDNINIKVNTLTTRLTNLEEDVERRLSKLEAEVTSMRSNMPVKESFDPKNSVIIFGIAAEEDEYLPAVVDDLLINVLQAKVTVIDSARTSPRDGKSGAIKVELSSTYEKLQILRLKSKFAEIKKYEKVPVRGCKDHSDRVHRLNSNYLLKLLGEDKDHVVVGNGVIRSKLEMAEFKKRQEEAKGDADDDTEGGGTPNIDPVQGANDAVPTDEESATPTPRAKMGDNTVSDKTKTTERKNPNSKATNKKASTPAEPKPKKSEQQAPKHAEDARARSSSRLAKTKAANADQ